MEDIIKHLKQTMFEKSKASVSKMRNMAGNAGCADIFSMWQNYTFKKKLERDSTKEAEEAKKKAKEQEERAQMKMLNSMGNLTNLAATSFLYPNTRWAMSWSDITNSVGVFRKTN